VRQAANLWQLKARLQHRLTQVSGAAADPVQVVDTQVVDTQVVDTQVVDTQVVDTQVVDTLPLPVCLFTRSCRDRCFQGEADYGYCAAKKLTYYGFKLELRTARCGMITHYPLLWARPHDVRHLQTLVEAFHGVVPADKGFIDPFEQTLLSVRHEVQVVTPQRQNMKAASPHPQDPQELLQACARWRKKIETVGSPLTERFAVARIRVHDLWHFQHRLIRKVLAHTVAVFLNLQLKRPPLDLDGLVAL
jgi:Transposase DDE domain